MKRLIFAIIFCLLSIMIPAVLAQGEIIRDAVSSLTDSINQMLQQGDEPVIVGELIINELFTDASDWEVLENRNAHLLIENGNYEIYANGTALMWGQNYQVHSDIVIQVDAEVLSAEQNNGYGVMCRADTENDRDGYHFWVSADGYSAILKIEDGDETPLRDWLFSRSVEQGQAINTLTAVCVGDYLALYVNSDLVAQARDDTYRHGVGGLSARTFVRQTDIQVAYDNLRMWTLAAENDDGRIRPLSVRELTNDADALLPSLTRMLTQGRVSVDIVRLDDAYGFDEDNGDWSIADFREGGITIEDGVYHLENNGSNPDIRLILGDNDSRHDNVVIQATMQNLENNIDTYAGVTCRANVDSDFLTGYIFWIGSDGFYSIYYGEEGGVRSLADRQRSDEINLGAGRNDITIVCHDEYLALYINGQLVEELEDDRITQGITTLSTTYLNDNGSVNVTFDNVRIWDIE